MHYKRLPRKTRIALQKKKASRRKREQLIGKTLVVSSFAWPVMAGVANAQSELEVETLVGSMDIDPTEEIEFVPETQLDPENASNEVAEIVDDGIVTEESKLTPETNQVEAPSNIVTPTENQPVEVPEVSTNPVSIEALPNQDIQKVHVPEANRAVAEKISFSKNQSTQEFIEKIGGIATEVSEKNNIYASVMIAQAILESGSGNSSLASTPNYNLFGVKGDFKGSRVSMATLEDDGSTNYYQITADFRKYPSYKESLEDYAQVIRNGPSFNQSYYSGAWKEHAKTYQEATKALTGKYATDTLYDLKLNMLIETYELTKYDEALQEVKNKEDIVESATPTSTPKNIVHLVEPNNSPITGMAKKNNVKKNQNSLILGTHYTVKKGDSLKSIAERSGVTMSKLKKLNQFKGSILFVNQSLVIRSNMSI